MATKYVVVNDLTGRKSLATLGSSLFVIEDFDVVIAGTTFTTSQDFGSTSILEVWKNGQKVREGNDKDFTRDHLNNQIVFNSTVAAGTWISIKIWS
jgi:hypothetical protein